MKFAWAEILEAKTRQKKGVYFCLSKSLKLDLIEIKTGLNFQNLQIQGTQISAYAVEYL